MTSHHEDHHENSAEANTHHADHSAQAHEAPASAPLFEGSGPKDWEEQFGPSVAIFSALANPLRLAIAHHLVHRPHSVSELHTCLGISQPLASHHLRILREAHVIDRPEERVEDFNLYGQRVLIEFVKRLRPMVAYTGVEALIEQINDDVVQTREVLAEDAKNYCRPECPVQAEVKHPHF